MEWHFISFIMFFRGNLPHPICPGLRRTRRESRSCTRVLAPTWERWSRFWWCWKSAKIEKTFQMEEEEPIKRFFCLWWGHHSLEKVPTIQSINFPLILTCTICHRSRRWWGDFSTVFPQKCCSGRSPNGKRDPSRGSNEIISQILNRLVDAWAESLIGSTPSDSAVEFKGPEADSSEEANALAAFKRSKYKSRWKALH